LEISGQELAKQKQQKNQTQLHENKKKLIKNSEKKKRKKK